MVLGIGKGTTLLQGYLTGTKRYKGVGLLGSSTDTGDSTGKVVSRSDCEHVTVQSIQKAARSFVGNILQVPPMYSALHHNGTRLYDLARRGVEVEREARPVYVASISVDSSTALPYFCLDVECGGGVYIRSLIADMGEACGTHAHMTELSRTKQGQFRAEECLYMENWNFEAICDSIRPLGALVGSSATLSENVEIAS